MSNLFPEGKPTLTPGSRRCTRPSGRHLGEQLRPHPYPSAREWLTCRGRTIRLRDARMSATKPNGIRTATEKDLEWLDNGFDPKTIERQTAREIDAARTASPTPRHWHPVDEPT